MQKSRTIQNHPRNGLKTARQRLKQILLKRVCLPSAIYEALPIIYICSGLVALTAAVHQPGWTWILPWAIVFGLAALHLGMGIMALRHRFRRKGHDTKSENPASKTAESE